jgi:chemotaxis receptor (MCP) glutamine deamidase CheD
VKIGGGAQIVHIESTLAIGKRDNVKQAKAEDTGKSIRRSACASGLLGVESPETSLTSRTVVAVCHA